MLEKSKKILLAATITSCFSTLAVANTNSQIDKALSDKFRQFNVTKVTPPPRQNPQLVELGRNLFFEKEVSGRRNISCATCHSPVLGSGDAQSQSRGQGGLGLGPHRQDDISGVDVPPSHSRPGAKRSFKFLARNTLSIWNRGVDGWDSMFWDGRLGQNEDGSFFSPAGDDTPQNFTNALAAFSIIPLTPDEEMRGFPGQPDVFGNPNEMANLTNDDFALIWPLVTARVTNNSNYDELLKAAFPYVEEKDINVVHLSEALGAFMTEHFTALNSDFDRYLAGDVNALSLDAKRGADLFYGRGSCANCHSGSLQTDLKFYNIAAPQVGTGRGASEALFLDLGRGAITEKASDNFKFRTPSLRNIELEAPYFHNGAFNKLEDAVRHHLNPKRSLENYDISQIEPELRDQKNTAINQQLLDNIAPELAVVGYPLTDSEIGDIMAFLSSLTDPSSLNQLDLVPDALPTGLPLAD